MKIVPIKIMIFKIYFMSSKKINQFPHYLKMFIATVFPNNFITFICIDNYCLIEYSSHKFYVK